MKITGLLLIVFFVMSTSAYSAESQDLSLQEQANVRQMAQEMSAQGVPGKQAQRMLSLMYRNQFQQQNIVRAQTMVNQTAQENLPTEPVINKAMEGMAKQVSQEQVLAAMETVRNRYSYAHRMARTLADDKKTNERIVQTIADSLAAGMTDQEMDAVMTQLRVETGLQSKKQAENLALQTMLTVRSMVRLGAKPADASDTVCQALQHRYTAQHMEQLRYQFSNQAHKTSGKQVAHQYASSVGTGSGSGGNDASGGNGSGGNGSGGNGPGGNGGGDNDSGGNGSGGNGGGDNDSGGNGSGGNGDGDNDSGGNGSGGNGGGGGGGGGGR